jgi:lysine 2,3-aminomutase
VLLPPVLEKRLYSSKPAAPWSHVATETWNHWVWQQQRRVRTLEQAEAWLSLTESEKIGIQNSSFQFALTPYYASLIDPLNPKCPIRQQSIPSSKEQVHLPYELLDPLAEERDMPVPGLTHRYPDRVLLYTTHHCPVYCRHCMRSRKVSDPRSNVDPKQLKEGIDYIRQTPKIRDVLLSGGDPLSLSDDRLVDLVGTLRLIPHVELIRLGTRNIVTLPQRVTPALVKRLQVFHPIFVHTHFNHPREVTREAAEAALLLAEHGFVVQNQSVLLRGVNDDASILLELNHLLLMMRIRPYYLHQCDFIKGAGHFRTSIRKGLEIIEALRGHTSGMAVPHYILDLPGGGGKISLVPERVVKQEGQTLWFRNFAGAIFKYEDSPSADEEFFAG